MSEKKLGAFGLIVGGTLGLMFRTVGYGRDSQTTSLGPLEISTSEQRTLKVPVWAGVGAITVGAVLLLAGRASKAQASRLVVGRAKRMALPFRQAG